MKTQHLGLMAAVGAALGAAMAVRGDHLGTKFTYQGRLERTGSPVTGELCDFRFGLWDAAIAGSQKGASPQTVLDVSVDGGLFMTGLDFGANAFVSHARWLEIEVQCPGDGAFVRLSPRVQMTPAPYALALAGLCTQETAGTTNIIGGYEGNTVASGLVGVTIAGGGLPDDGSGPVEYHRVLNNYGTIGGGAGNQAGLDPGAPPLNQAVYATVGGGASNTASGRHSTVGGGDANTAGGVRATVGGGESNIASGDYAIVAGGNHNSATYTEAGVCGGLNNVASGQRSFVGGGNSNDVSALEAAIGGGFDNNGSGQRSFIGGGDSNEASGVDSAVAGGHFNVTSGNYAVVCGGQFNNADGVSSTISGGNSNTASLNYATVGGGEANTASEWHATVGGGSANTARGTSSTVPGGYSNEAGGTCSFAAGNRAHVRSTALGDPATDNGTFVWADLTAADFVSTGSNQFLIRAGGGVGINTNAPDANAALSVNGNIAIPWGNGITTTNTAHEGRKILELAWEGTSGDFVKLYVPGAGTPNLVPQLMLSERKGVFVDPNGTNAGDFGVDSLALRFGNAGSGEGIASKRTAGGNLNGLDLYTAFLSRLSITNGGDVGIGDASPDARLDVEESGDTVAIFNRGSNDGTIIEFQQAGTTEGSISVTGAIVTFNAFTGSHYGATEESLDRGMLVTMNGRNRRLHGSAESEPIYGVAATATPNDPRCLGAYLGVLEPKRPVSDDNPHQIMAVGNGEMWIVDTGRDIAPGDYLISSDVRGHAMLDDDAKFPVGHVIARAAESVEWANATDRLNGRKHARISVTFENFERGSAEIAKLAERNRQLEARLAAVEAMLKTQGGGK